MIYDNCDFIFNRNNLVGWRILIFKKYQKIESSFPLIRGGDMIIEQQTSIHIKKSNLKAIKIY